MFKNLTGKAISGTFRADLNHFIRFLSLPVCTIFATFPFSPHTYARSHRQTRDRFAFCQREIAMRPPQRKLILLTLPLTMSSGSYSPSGNFHRKSVQFASDTIRILSIYNSALVYTMANIETEMHKPGPLVWVSRYSSIGRRLTQAEYILLLVSFNIGAVHWTDVYWQNYMRHERFTFTYPVLYCSFPCVQSRNGLFQSLWGLYYCLWILPGMKKFRCNEKL